MAADPADALAPDAWQDPAGLRLVGDPVDVVTGRVREQTRCFRLIGPIELGFYRFYDSGRGTARGFGRGHAHTADDRLAFDLDGLMLEEAAGTLIAFPALAEDGATASVLGRTLRRDTLQSYRLFRPGVPVAHFSFTDPALPARLRRLSRGNECIVFDYGADGTLTRITHSTGRHIAAEEHDGRLLALHAAWDGGSAMRSLLLCEYDDAGDCVGMVDALGRRSAFAYDEANRLVVRTDRRGYRFFYQYDAAGRCIGSAGEDGVLGVRLRYRPETRLTEVLRSDRGLWVYHYNDAGTITRIVGPDGDERRFLREAGRTIGEIDAIGVRLDYVFDRSGKLAAKKFASGRVIPVQAGEDIAVAPPHRVADCSAHSMLGDLLANLAVQNGWEDLPPATRRALLPWSPPLPDAPHVEPFGNLPWYPKPGGGRVFGPFGHLLRQDLPGGGSRSWTYDGNDSLDTITDADGVVQRLKRRSLNQLAAMVDALGQDVQYRFTTEDRVCAVRDAGGTLTEYAYDTHRRLRGVRRGGELRETYRYDLAGNLLEKYDGTGATMLRLVPTADRLVAERHLVSGGVHRFAYHKSGRILGAQVEGGCKIRFEYDRAGRRICDERDGRGVMHGRQGSTVLGHFRIGRKAAAEGVTLTLPGGVLIRLERLAQGVIRRSCSTGLTELSQFDVMGRCVASLASHPADKEGWARRWRYSAEGDLLEAEDSMSGPMRYRYDVIHRLVGMEGQGVAASFAFDAGGNLVSQPGLSGVGMGAANRLAAANGEIFDYDVRHHIARRESAAGATAYTYDSRDMLVRVERPGLCWQAEYDPIGRRTHVLQGDAKHVFYWDTDRLAAEIFPDGQLRVFVYADALALTPTAFIDYAHEDSAPDEGAVRLVLTDQRGAPVRILDKSGTVLWEASLAPYGAARLRAPAGLVLNLRFPGHYFDAATGLQYNRFRYYDPHLGRYIQSDPIGIGGGINVYAYPANPLVMVDVRGLTGHPGDGCEHQTNSTVGETPDDKETTGAPAAADDDLEAKVKQSQDAYQRALGAADDLDGRNASKCVSSDGDKTISGWSDKPPGFTAVDPAAVIAHSDEIGHTLPSSGARDHGVEGQALASHAEKQQSIANPNQPQGVDMDMCPNCQKYMSKEAAASGQPQIVTDPTCTRIFHPNGMIEERYPNGTRSFVMPK